MKYVNGYLEEIKKILSDINLANFDNKTICLSGATGLIGSYLIDSLLINQELKVKIIALVRNIDKAKERFSYFKNDSRLIFKEVNLMQEIDVNQKIDYLIHAASLTDPYNYATHPIDTMSVNFLGTKNMLDLATKSQSKFMFVSSCEVYGKNENILIKEDEYGYVNILDPRSCYNESKKASETLCVCYQKEKNIEIVIPRLSRVYGPTMKIEDTKALSQFIKKGLNNENIVLKSKGTQLFDYTYVGDVVRAMIILLISKNNNIAYNISANELIPLKDIASFIAEFTNTKVVFEIPDEIEQSGYSKSLTSSMDSSLFINEYHFKFKYLLFEGIKNTITLLKEIN